MTINLNGVEFYSAQEVDERIREAIAGKDKEVDMSNLPIGAKVEVIGNSTGHEHEYGEVLEITKVENDEVPYLLDDRTFGWVAIEDIEFVSFPEEEESTSGDEGMTLDEDESEKYPAVGTKVKAKRETPWTTVGKVYEVLSITESSPYPIIVTDDEDDDIYTLKMFEEFFEILKPLGQDANGVDLYEGDTITVTEQSSGESEEDSEIKAGDIVIATEDDVYGDITEGSEYEIREGESGSLHFIDDDGDIRLLGHHKRRLRKKEAERGFKAGDIVIATEDEFDITEGNEYEIKERETGTLYFLDDDGDIRHVNVHEDRLRKKPAKRVFKKGDVVYVKEEITDNSGDSICPGVITEFILDRGVLTPDGTFVVVGDGDIGKLTLVCRAEDRQDD